MTPHFDDSFARALAVVAIFSALRMALECPRPVCWCGRLHGLPSEVRA